MKKFLLFILWILIVMGIPIILAIGHGKTVNGESLNISWDDNNFSRYMLWGVPFSDGWVYQPTLGLTYNENLIFLLFGNYDYKQKKWNEGDVIAEFSKSIHPKMNVTVGSFYFHFDAGDSWENTGAVYFGISANMLFNPSITYYNLFGFDEGNNVECAISKNFPINSKITVFSFGKLGYNNKAFREKTGFSHTEFGVKIPIQLPFKFVLMPTINYLKALADDLDDIFYGGATIHYDF